MKQLRRRLLGIKYQPGSSLRFVRTVADASAWSHIDSSQVFTDVQDAIDDCPVGGAVIIAKGTYKPQRISPWLASNGYSDIEYHYGFSNSKNISVKGGYNGDEVSFSYYNHILYPVIIDGDLHDSGDYHDYVRSLMIVGSDCAFYGIHFTKSYEPLGTDAYTPGGTFSINGLRSYPKPNNVTLVDCEFSLGYSKLGGLLSIRNVLGQIMVSNCKFHDFVGVPISRGALSVYTVNHLTFKNCEFYDNTGGNWCVLYSYQNTPDALKWINCLFYNNTGTALFGASGYSLGEFVNCTVKHSGYILRGNTDTQETWATFKNCIMFDITGVNSLRVLQTSNYFYNSNVKGSGGSGSWNAAIGNDGGGNIETDPLFTNEAGLDFTLQSSSPCIDTGDNSFNTQTEDLLGNPRIVDGDGDSTETVDMGCYEYQS